MSTKWLVFSLLLSLGATGLRAQEVEPAQAAPEAAIMQESVKHDTVYIYEYDRRIQKYRERWQAFIPSHLKLHYAGNMGLISIGTGWDYGKHDQWETDILFGFLPKYKSEKNKLTFTLKQNYIPWKLPLGHTPLAVEPLTCGLYLNTVFGDEFWTQEPDRFPKGYYGFSSRVRANIFIGQRLTFHTDRRRSLLTKEITLFYELSTSDLYLVSAFTNSYLKAKDYVSLSFGVKFQLL